MKKIITISVLTVALLSTACSSPGSFTEHEEIAMEDLSENPFYKLSVETRLDKLQNYIDDIDTVLIGEFIEDTEREFSYRYCEYFKKDIQVGSYTHSKLLVTEVFKGDVKPGDIITVAQGYRFIGERNALSSSSELTPMNTGDRWIHLGGFGEDGMFYNAPKRGRFPIPSKEILRIVEEYTRNIDEAIKSALGNSMGITQDELWEMGKTGQAPELGTPNKDGEYIYINDDSVVYRYESHEDWDKHVEEVAAIWKDWKVRGGFDNIDTLTLGRLEREDFNFWVYVQILNYFQIEAENWVNPGRESDAKLAEMEIIDLWKLSC
ncbi:MAG: hypothetical protein FWH07_04740 [Oscillospiraceae bacterium]|nr:hypothetical protein [Oscillospiraceae bacterium]